MGRIDKKKARLSHEIRLENLFIFLRVMSAKARKLPKILITLNFCNHFSTLVIVWLEISVITKKKKRKKGKNKKDGEEEEKNWKLQSRWFVVVDRRRSKAKCTKEKIARAKREKQLFFIVKFVSLCRSCSRQRVNRAVWQTRYPMSVSSKDHFTENSQSKNQASHAILMHCFLVLCIQICNVLYILLTNSLQRWSSQSWYNITIEFRFAGINMFWARLRLTLARAAGEG